MRGRLKLDRPIWNTSGAPLVALVYFACAYTLRAVGCLPQFVDTDFFGVPVVQFLLAALVVAALTLTVLAALAAVRQLRVARRLRRSVDASARVRRWALLGIVLAACTFPIIAFIGAGLLTTSCG